MTDTHTTEPPQTDDRRALRNVAVLVTTQGVAGAQMPMIFTIGGLAGQSLAPNPCWATLPISLIVLGSMLSATPLSALMQRHGRRAGFWTGTAGGTIGAILGALGLYHASFGLFLLGGLFTGIYMSAQGFFRFAAMDSASDAFRPKAVSYVMAGGLLAAVTGPQLVKFTAEAMVIPFLGTYLAVIGVNLAGAVLIGFLDAPAPPRPAPGAARRQPRTRLELLRDPVIAVAITCAMVSYALMNLVMTSTPLAVVGCGFETGDAADVVTAHVLAMYAPSFVTGHIIARIGAEKVVGLGLMILAGAGAVALSGVELEQFFVALILLGIGWNDLIVFGGVTAASLSSGTLMNCSGAGVEAGWQAVNLAMVPFLVLAGASLIWLVLRPRAA